MNILFLDAYFRPETIAYTHLENDLIEGLVAKGNKITVICPTPTRGIAKETRKKYKYIRKESLYGGSVRVIRFWAPQEGKNPLIRAFRYLWCNLRTYQKARKESSVDLIFSNSTPPTQGLLGVWTAKYLSKKSDRVIPFVYNLQDIFPDSLVNTKLASEKSIIWRVGRIIEDYTYKHATKIITISEGFKNNILKKGVIEKKVSVVSNWIDVERVYPVVKQENKLFDEFSIPRDKFLVLYAGNFGVSQGADVILRAAKILKKNEDKDIHFVIFGGGPEFLEAQTYIHKNALNNVSIHSLLPMERVSEVYSLGDIALITCKSGIGNAGMPSKTWSIMACNTPIIASFDIGSELDVIITDSKSGICIAPENEEVLAKTILLYKEESLDSMKNGRDYVLKHAARESCVEKYCDILKRSIRKEEECI